MRLSPRAFKRGFVGIQCSFEHALHNLGFHADGIAVECTVSAEKRVPLVQALDRRRIHAF